MRGKPGDTTGDIAYVTFSGFGSCAGCDGKGHVFKTKDGGTTWTDISGDLPDAPVNAIIVDHNGNPTFDALYIGTDVGVFSCPDPESTTATPCTNWTVIGDGLPNSPVLGLAMRPTSRILRAFTHGRSAWHIQLTDENPPAVAALGSLTPAAVMAGSATTTVNVTGVNFSSKTLVFFGGTTTGVTTTFVNTTQMTVMFDKSLLTLAGVFDITLSDPAGASTNPLPFTVMNPILNPQTMTPTSALTFTPVHLHLTGTNFVPSTVLALFDTSMPPILQTQLFGGTPSAGGTVFDLTTDVFQFTNPASYKVLPYNPTPGGGIDPASPAPFPLTITANPGPLAQIQSPIVLGPIALGANTSLTALQVQNPGATNTLNITNATLTGTNAANFVFVAPTMAPSCNFETTKTASVPPGLSCFFGIQYTAGTPPGLAESTATLTVTDNAADSPQIISVLGFVNVPNTPFVFLTSLNFGYVAIGVTSPTMNSTLFNFTSAPLNVSAAGFTLTGTNAGDFNVVAAVPVVGQTACPAAPFPLAVNKSCNVGVTFTPSLAGNENATINVSDDGPNSPQKGFLFGIGVEITSISPSIVATGGPAFTLTVNGGGFASSAVVNVNGSARLTTFVSANQLQASIPASDITTAGSLAISVTTPFPGGATSEPKTLIVAQAPTGTNDSFADATDTTATFRHPALPTSLKIRPCSQRIREALPTRRPRQRASPPEPSSTAKPRAPGSNSSRRPPESWLPIRAIAAIQRSCPSGRGTTGSFVAVAAGCNSGNIPGTAPAPAESFVSFGVTNGTNLLPDGDRRDPNARKRSRRDSHVQSGFRQRRASKRQHQLRQERRSCLPEPGIQRHRQHSSRDSEHRDP